MEKTWKNLDFLGVILQIGKPLGMNITIGKTHHLGRNMFFMIFFSKQIQEDESV